VNGQYYENKGFDSLICRRFGQKINKKGKLTMSAESSRTTLEKAWDSETNFVRASRPDLVLTLLSMTGKERVRVTERK